MSKQGDPYAETYTTTQAAARLWYEDRHAIIGLIQRGQLRGVRVPGGKTRYRVSVADVEQLRAAIIAKSEAQRAAARSLKQLWLDLAES